MLLRIFRACLRLYPGEFRDEYGRELSLVLADRLRDEPSALRRVTALAEALLGIAIEAPLEHLQVLREDVLYAFRLVRRETRLTLAIVLMLALGIGTATLVFTLANGLLLRPLPYVDSDRLVTVEEYSPKDPAEFGRVSLPNYADIRARTRLLEDVGVYVGDEATIKGGSAAEVLPAAFVTDGTLKLLGVQPLFGRTFTAEDTRPNAARVVILSHELHQRRFGSDPAIVGRTLETLNARFTIVGVMPDGFHFPAVAEAWFPLREDPSTAPRTDYFLHAVARLKPGVTVEQADAEMRATLEQIHSQHRPNNGWVGRARPLRTTLAADYRAGVLVLLAAAVVLLSIACGNAANLLLVRASARRREVAVRTALGATRRRLVRQMMTESLFLATAGGVGGVALAYFGVPTLLRLVPIVLPRWMNFSIDARVLAFAVGVSIVTSAAFGIVPALAVTGTGMAGTLKEEGRGVTSGRRQKAIRQALVVSELALSMALLAGASLAARSFLKERLQALGYDTRDVLSMTLNRSEEVYATPTAQRALLARIKETLLGIPGVDSVAFTTGIPLHDGWGRIFTIEGRPLPLDAMTAINHVVVTPAYFRTLNISLLQGRDFSETDFDQRVLIVSRSFAARHFPGDTALGKRLRFGPPKNNEPWYTIVGVVADSRHGVLKGTDRDNVYLPYFGDVMPNALLLRTSEDPTRLIGTIERRIHDIDRDIAVTNELTLDQIVDRTAWQDRLLAVLFAAFACLALTLAAAGFYAVLAYTVALQTHEIGVRMALGATARGVRAMVLREALALAAAGLAIGLSTAAGLAYVLRSFLYRVSPLDPVSYAITPALFMFTAFLAAYVPSRRATRVDPIIALRHD